MKLSACVFLLLIQLVLFLFLSKLYEVYSHYCGCTYIPLVIGIPNHYNPTNGQIFHIRLRDFHCNWNTFLLIGNVSFSLAAAYGSYHSFTASRSHVNSQYVGSVCELLHLQSSTQFEGHCSWSYENILKYTYLCTYMYIILYLHIHIYIYTLRNNQHLLANV